MTWNKPRTIWSWLALLSPAAVSLAMTAFGKLLLTRENEAVPSVLGLPVALVLCLVLACWLSRGTGSFGKSFALAIAFMVPLVIVNFAIAFGGCAVMNPHLDLR
ncbi:MAG: hypothetical protein ACREF8_04155 [Chthoniobacterales bacterium]